MQSKCFYFQFFVLYLHAVLIFKLALYAEGLIFVLAM